MSGRILQINISPGGIPKRPISEGQISDRGILGDACRNRKYHGGPLQAILLITLEGLQELNALGYDLFPGALGENLTTTGLDRRVLRIGQKLQAGEALLELTKVRVPCQTLNPYGPGVQAAMYDTRVKGGDSSSPRWGLSGFYARVLQPGFVRQNDTIAILDRAVCLPNATFA